MATVEGLGTHSRDPLLHDIELPLQGTYFAHGFPVSISTNSPRILEAAQASWGMCQREFATDPIELRIIVRPEGGYAAEPVFRSQRHYFTIVSDRDNHAFYDSRSMFGCCFVSEKTAGEAAWFRYYYLETMVYMLLAQRHIVPVHAACVARGGSGVLLCGWSGAGKSTLSFACARAGWTFLSDDSTWLLPGVTDRSALGKPHSARFRHDARRHFPELEGRVANAHPNGKLSIDVPMSALPQIQTAARCRVGCLVELNRQADGPARAEAIPAAEVTERMMEQMPSYGDEVQRMVEATLGGLVRVPAYRLTYARLDGAVQVLGELKHSVR